MSDHLSVTITDKKQLIKAQKNSALRMLHRKIKDDFYNMVIFDDNVLDIISQPETFKLETDKNIITYTPENVCFA